MLGRVLLPLPPHNSFPPPTWGIPRPPRRSRPLFGNDHRGTKWDRGPGSFPRRPLQGPSWTPPGPPAALQTGPARSENAEGRGEDWPRAGHRAAPGRGRPRGPRPPDSPRPRGTGGAGRGGPAPATSFADPSHRPAGPRPSCPRPTAAIPAHGSPPTRHIGDGVGGLCPRTVPYDHHRVLSTPPQRTPGQGCSHPEPAPFRPRAGYLGLWNLRVSFRPMPWSFGKCAPGVCTERGHAGLCDALVTLDGAPRRSERAGPGVGRQSGSGSPHGLRTGRPALGTAVTRADPVPEPTDGGNRRGIRGKAPEEGPQSRIGGGSAEETRRQRGGTMGLTRSLGGAGPGFSW